MAVDQGHLQLTLLGFPGRDLAGGATAPLDVDEGRELDGFESNACHAELVFLG